MPFRTYSIPEQNVVDISRIESGLDKRNTLLIRNIPNRVDFQDLKGTLDAVIKGEYEFLCKYSVKFIFIFIFANISRKITNMNL